MSTLFFDLDGTLIDVTKRHLAVYHIVAPKLSLPLLSDQEYLSLKQKHLFPAPDSQKELFRKVYKEQSEQKEFLEMDTVIPGILPFLEHMTKIYTCVLVTKRYHQENLMVQLRTLGLAPFFTAVLTPNPESKAEAIQTYGVSKKDVVIGDTEEDIQTAKTLEIPSVAVTWGVRSKTFLETFSPTYVVQSVAELMTLLTR